MKKYLFLLIFLLLPQFVFAIVLPSDPTALDQIYITGSNQVYDFGRSGGTQPVSLFWYYYPGASHNICSATVALNKTGTPVDSVKMSFLKNTTLGTASTTLPTAISWVAMQDADSQFQITSTTTTAYTFTFTPCVVVVGETPGSTGPYEITLSRTGSNSNTDYYSFEGAISGDGRGKGTNGTGQWRNGRIHADGSSTNYSPIYGTTAGWAISFNGTQNYSAINPNDNTQSQCTPPSNILDVGGGISYSFCYLFVPAQSVISQFGNLSTFLSGKFPFAYFTDFSDSFSGQANPNGTSSPNFTYTATGTAISGININLGTALDNTIGTGNEATIKGWIAIALWFALGSYYFFRIKGMFH